MTVRWEKRHLMHATLRYTPSKACVKEKDNNLHHLELSTEKFARKIRYFYDNRYSSSLLWHIKRSHYYANVRIYNLWCKRRAIDRSCRPGKGEREFWIIQANYAAAGKVSECCVDGLREWAAVGSSQSKKKGVHKECRAQHFVSIQTHYGVHNDESTRPN